MSFEESPVSARGSKMVREGPIEIFVSPGGGGMPGGGMPGGGMPGGGGKFGGG